MATSSVRIILVEDFEPFRRVLCSILRTNPELQIISEVLDGLEAVRKVLIFPVGKISGKLLKMIIDVNSAMFASAPSVEKPSRSSIQIESGGDTGKSSCSNGKD